MTGKIYDPFIPTEKITQKGLNQGEKKLDHTSQGGKEGGVQEVSGEL